MWRCFRRRRDADLDEEIRAHLDMAARDRRAAGATEDEAQTGARHEFGNVALVKDATRAMWGWTWLERARDDGRHAVRLLVRDPVYAAVSIGCIAVGVAATTTIFAAVYGILLRPLPFDAAGDLVVVKSSQPARDVHRSAVSWADFVSWREQQRALTQLEIWTAASPVLSGPEGPPERIDGAQISSGLFDLLGLAPAAGRTFVSSEDLPDRSLVVLLGHDLWQQRFGGDPAIVGRSIQVNNAPHVVVGIMPSGVGFPEGAQIWTPLVPNPADTRHDNRRFAGTIGRLKPGATLEGARAELDTISRRLQIEFPADNAGWQADAVTLRDDLVGDLRKPVLIFQGAAVIVLLIACANLASLALARSTRRERETAIRIAIGAGHARIAQHLLTQSLLLALAGGTLGAFGATFGVRFLSLAFPDGVPSYIGLSIDGVVLVFAVAISTATGILFGAAPALRSGRAMPAVLLRGDRGSDPPRGRVRAALLTAETALSLVLFSGAALLGRSALLLEFELGFEPRGVVSIRVPLPYPAYDETRRAAFYERLFTRVRSLDGVIDVGSTPAGVPLAVPRAYARRQIFVPGRPDNLAGAIVHDIGPGYFRTLGVPVLAGREFAWTDRSDSFIGVVNETFVRTFLPGEPPIGRQIQYSADNEVTSVTIVGLVKDFRQERPPAPIAPALFWFRPTDMASQTIVVRTNASDPLSVVPAIRTVVRDLDPALPTYLVQRVDHAVARGLWRERMQSQVVGIFAAVALLFAAVGVYGVITYVVARRTREFGVRIALGATPGIVVGGVLRDHLRPVLAGLGLGLLSALALSRVLDGLLYGVRATDAPTFIGVTIALGLIAFLAALFPARRAARVDPVIALRSE
jgi:predicted permease